MGAHRASAGTDRGGSGRDIGHAAPHSGVAFSPGRAPDGATAFCCPKGRLWSASPAGNLRKPARLLAPRILARSHARTLHTGSGRLHGESTDYVFEDDGPSPFAQCVTAEAAHLVWRCVSHLPARQRALLTFRYRHDWTFGAIADNWGVTEVAVHRMHGRAIVALRIELADCGVTRLGEVL